jgi:hypothetical protein
MLQRQVVNSLEKSQGQPDKHELMNKMRFPAAKLTPTRYILIVLQLLRKDARFFLAGTLVAVALRLVFVLHFPGIVDDSRLYADIAMNWLQYGVYGITNSGHVVPTLSRLPGYPAFLAAVFAVFGWSNFRAVLLIQVLFDLGSCFLVADLARRLFDEPAAKAAFMLAAVCPFLANYSAAALTETLEIFFTVLALDLACSGFTSFSPQANSKSTAVWIGCGLSVGSLHPVAARRWNSAGCRRRFFVSTFSEGNPRTKIGNAPPASHSARRNYFSRQRSRAVGPLDAAQPAHAASLRTARASLRQRFR